MYSADIIGETCFLADAVITFSSVYAEYLVWEYSSLWSL